MQKTYHQILPKITSQLLFYFCLKLTEISSEFCMLIVDSSNASVAGYFLSEKSIIRIWLMVFEQYQNIIKQKFNIF